MLLFKIRSLFEKIIALQVLIRNNVYMKPSFEKMIALHGHIRNFPLKNKIKIFKLFLLEIK